VGPAPRGCGRSHTTARDFIEEIARHTACSKGLPNLETPDLSGKNVPGAWSQTVTVLVHDGARPGVHADGHVHVHVAVRVVTPT
jgi:hypothetical protein